MIKVGDYAIFRNEQLIINGFFVKEILGVGKVSIRTSKRRFNIRDEGKLFWVVKDLEQAEKHVAQLNQYRDECNKKISSAKETYEQQIKNIISLYEVNQ